MSLTGEIWDVVPEASNRLRNLTAGRRILEIPENLFS